VVRHSSLFLIWPAAPWVCGIKGRMVGQLNDKAKVYDYMDPVGFLRMHPGCKRGSMGDKS
jgi:hypothetical protein